jgi:hypothetical protein
MYKTIRYQQTFVKKYFYLEIRGISVTLWEIITHGKQDAQINTPSGIVRSRHTKQK